MPESGANPDNIARLIDANRDPELFWWICDRGTMTPRIPALQAMMEMLFHPDIDLHPHAVGETLDQIAYHAPVSVVEAYLSRIEMLIADAPDRAADCWTDLTQNLTERMTNAERGDLGPRIAAIDQAVERILRDEDRRAMHAAFKRFDAVAAGDWDGSDIEAAMKAFEEYGTWHDLLPDCLAALEPRRSDPFWCAVLMRAIATHVRGFQGTPDDTVGEWIADALGQEDQRPAGDAARAGLAVLASRFAPALGERLAAAAEDRRPFARGDLHEALTDLLRHARPSNSTDGQVE